MFGRNKSKPADKSATTPDVPRSGGKGRPTPTRREAEAAARARAKTPRNRKEQAAARREQRAASSQKMREAMKSGDDKYLPKRDQGPVRRFIRDYVDTRMSYVEIVLPLMLIGLLLGWTGNAAAAAWANAVLMAALVLVLLDLVILRFRVRREVGKRFSDAPLKGVTYYAITRQMQMKFMRMPKAQRKLGEKLPAHYR